MIAAVGRFHSQKKVLPDTGTVLSLSRARVPQSTHYILSSPYYHHIHHLSWKEDTGWHWPETFAFRGSNRFWWKNKVLGNQWFCFKIRSQYGEIIPLLKPHCVSLRVALQLPLGTGPAPEQQGTLQKSVRLYETSNIPLEKTATWKHKSHRNLITTTQNQANIV